MLQPGRHETSDSYRYGFNGKENDNEVMGEGNFEDYGMRMYNPRISRFFNVDPLTKKFPMLTPYQFASNTPIWAVDLDGLEARVYNDLSALPHSFISVIDDDGVINVYTFGQYGQKGAGVAGQGALVHLKGEDANNYINYEFEHYKDNMSVYEISSENIDKQKIIDYYADEMKKYNVQAKKVEPHAPVFANKENGSNAVIYKPYVLLPDSFLSENCTSVTLDGMEAGGFSVWSSFMPWDLNAVLKFRSIFGQTKNVTDTEKKRAKNNENTSEVKKKSSDNTTEVKKKSKEKTKQAKR